MSSSTSSNNMNTQQQQACRQQQSRKQQTQHFSVYDNRSQRSLLSPAIVSQYNHQLANDWSSSNSRCSEHTEQQDIAPSATCSGFSPFRWTRGGDLDF